MSMSMWNQSVALSCPKRVVNRNVIFKKSRKRYPNLKWLPQKKSCTLKKKKVAAQEKKLRDRKNKSCGETSSAATILGSPKGPKSCGIIIKRPKKVAAWEKSCGILNVHFDRHSARLSAVVKNSVSVHDKFQCSWIHRDRPSSRGPGANWTTSDCPALSAKVW